VGLAGEGEGRPDRDEKARHLQRGGTRSHREHQQLRGGKIILNLARKTPPNFLPCKKGSTASAPAITPREDPKQHTEESTKGQEPSIYQADSMHLLRLQDQHRDKGFLDLKIVEGGLD